MSRRRSGPPLLGCLLVAFFAIGTLAILGWLAIAIPNQAVEIFGAPTPGLGTLQRLRTSFDLSLNARELTDAGGPAGAKQTVEIHLGDAVGTIVTRLTESGLIRNPDLFTEYLVYKGYDTRMQAGSYTLDATLSPVEIAAALIDTTPKDVDFGVLAGWRLEEIAAVLPTSGMSIAPDEFLQAAHNLDLAPGLKAELPVQASLEGFLLPGKYTFPRDTSAAELLAKLTGQFEAQVTPEMRQGFEKQGLTLYQAVTLASLVEKEAVMEDEQPTIASVFYNRLAKGMRLESDPTVQYALGYNADQHTWWTNPLSAADLQTDSPYNTYSNVGLPPGPIANPGISALKAVAEPAQTEYYYFRARCDGSHRHQFAATLDEHIQNACP
jgi:UPF0755 protein